MPDPALPASIMDEIRELRRRVERLEMSSRLTSASLTDGAFRVLDATGQERVVMGRQSDGTYGLVVLTDAGRKVLRITEDGQTIPRIYPPVMQNATSLPLTAASGTTSGSFTELLRADLYATAPEVYITYLANINGTATGEWKVTIQEAGGTATDVLTTVSATGQAGGTFTIPTACLVPDTGTEVVERSYVVRVVGRRTSGTGTIYAAPITLSCPP